MRIAIVTHKFSRNDGQGRVNYEIARYAAAMGHEVCLIASSVAPELLESRNVRWTKVGYGRVPTNLVRYQVFAFGTWNWLRKHRDEFDILHVNGAVTWEPGDVNTVHYVHAGWRRSPQYSVSPGLRGLYEEVYTQFNMLAERKSFYDAGTVVAVSRTVAAEVVDAASNLTNARLEAIPNGVDTNEFRPVELADRSRFGLPNDAVIALFAGDLLSERKNLDTVLSAVAGAPGLHLAVAGLVGGSRFPALAASLGIADRVHFLGMVSEMPALMQAVDLFVLPSRYEPWGMVIAEAMASGLPVVTSRETGAAQLIGDGAGFVLGDPDNVHELSAVLRQLATDAGLRSRVGHNARTAVLGLSWENMARQYVALYEDLLAKRTLRTRQAKAS